MCRANRKNILKTECGKFVGSRLVFRVIDFVNEKQDGFVQFPNQASQFAIHRIYPVLPVHHKKDEIALCHRQFCGRPHLVRQLGFPRTDNPAGIPKPESFPTDFAFGRNPVPCDPCLAMYNGDATAGNPVEQRRFSYIRPADDSDVHRTVISEEIPNDERRRNDETQALFSTYYSTTPSLHCRSSLRVSA